MGQTTSSDAVPSSFNRRDLLKAGAGLAAGVSLAPISTSVQANPMTSKQPNVVFVLTDQWRAQAMGYAEEDPVSTPQLDAFKQEAAHFSHALACSPVCGPNRACIFTGLYPQHHGVIKNNQAAVNPDQLLSQVFKKAGYRNGYIGKWHLNGRDAHSVHKGMTPEATRRDYDYWTSAIHNHAHFRLEFEENGERVDYGDGWQPDHLTDKAIDFINVNDDRPFNLVVSYSPPHNGNYHPELCAEKRYTPGDLSHKKNGYGYYAPVEYETPYLHLKPDDIRGNVQPIRQKGGDGYDTIDTAIAGYYGACTAIDTAFGRLIQHLKSTGQFENTIIVFTSDHGEMMGSQGLMTKGVCFEESIRVPLLIFGPGIRPQTSNLLFNSIDLMPTILGLTGQNDKLEADGQDYSQWLQSDAIPSNQPDMAFLGYANWRGVRTHKHTYITSTHASGLIDGRESLYLKNKRNIRSSHLLFDLTNDPLQENPILFGDDHHTDAVISELHENVRNHMSTLGENIQKKPS